ncbi:MAG: DNA primase [Holosporales bacterium]|jgi:DNA primase|nr:DNA primase [Holosporales bacterium]
MGKTDLNLVIQWIKNKIPLSKIVEIDVVLKRKGREFVGQCPFHLEKTGSFYVNDEKGTFYCFGCGASGDIIEYVKKKDRIEFVQAVEKLAGLAGIKLPEKGEYHHKFEHQKKLLHKALEIFKGNLMQNKMALEYCENRNIDSALIEKFGIGYSNDDYDSLLAALRPTGFSDADLLASGLFLSKDKKLIPRFRNRLMFPVFNRDGWPIAFGGRAILKEAHSSKYINSPETDLFRKRETLYAYNIASRNASANKPLIVVEGYIDVLMMHKFGFDTAIASMGTSLSEEHLAKFWRYSREPILCFDGDAAGRVAMDRILHMAMKYLGPGKSLRFCLLPKKTDPDSLLQSAGGKGMEEALAKSLSTVDFLWDFALRTFDDLKDITPESIAEWKSRINSHIDDISDLEVRKLYYAELKERFYTFGRQGKKKQHGYNHTKLGSITIDKSEKVLLREALLLYTIIMRPSIVSFVAEELATVDWSNLGFEKIRGVLLSLDETEIPDFTGLEDVIAKVKSMCWNHCNFNEMNDEEMLSFWSGIFQRGFVEASQKRDLIAVKEECTQELSSEKWERLKALKIDSLYKKDGK